MMRLGYPCAIPRHCLALRDDYHPSIHPNLSVPYDTTTVARLVPPAGAS